MNNRGPFAESLGIEYPIICGAMYPCSNPELIAAVSEGGGIGIVQPLSLIYAHKLDLREGLRQIRRLTSKPYGFNVLTEQSSKIYQDRMRKWVEIALEEGCRFFITALGNPKWIVERVRGVGGIVYHDVTELKWAEKALEAGVNGLICVNNRAGGHAGTLSPEILIRDLGRLGVPLICAGGIGDEAGIKAARELGYSGVQLGTRFIATTECTAHDDYKSAILKARESDIVLTKRLTGVPVSIIRTASVEKEGTEAGFITSAMLKHPKLKHWARLWFSLNSFRKLKNASAKGLGYQDYWQAGKSVEGIESIESARVIAQRFGRAWLNS